jgi:hypothetical protein
MIITEFVDQKIHGTSFSTESYGCLLKKTTELLGAGFLLPIWLWINTY